MGANAAKKESQAVEGIKDYDRVRRFLRNIHLYGFFSCEDFKKAGIASTSDYNVMAALIRAVMPEVEAASIWRERKKYPRVRREYARSGESRLADSYLLHVLDEKKELPELLRLLPVLSMEWVDLRKLAAEVEYYCGDGEESKYPTVRRRVLDLMEYGVLEEKKRTYFMKKDVLEQLDVKGLRQLRTYVSFSGGVTYPRVAASFLVRTIDRELLRRGIEVKKDAAILLRHGVNNSVFDEELVYTLLSAIREKKTVILSIEKGGEKKEVRKLECLPLALRVDCRLGRWYLLGKERRLTLRRVSNIRKAQLGQAVEEAVWQEAYAEGRDYYRHTGVSGALPHEHPVLVEAELRFGEFRGMRKQFMREMRLGTVIEKDGKEYYQALVNDPGETLPLLRSYAPWLRVSSGEHDLDVRLQDSLSRMRDALKEVDGE